MRLILSLCLAAAAAAHAEPVALLVSAPDKGWKSDRVDRVLRSRPVAVRGDLLADAKSVGGAVTLELFDGVVVPGRIAAHAKTAGGAAARVDFEFPALGDAHFSTVGGAVAARIALQGIGEYEVRPDGRGGHVLVEWDWSGVTGCAAGHFPGNRPRAPLPDPGAPKGVGVAEIDVMVAYTPAVRVAAGGESGVLALINLAFVLTNESYANSLINAQINLVHTVETDYAESGDTGVDLAYLTFPNDGQMDEIHALRNQYGADLVALLVASGNACGTAWIMDTLSTDFANRGFSVTEDGCITNLTFGHEIGHNLGCAHDRQNASGGLFPYSWGWRFTGNNSVLYRTVMAYAPGQRINHFSNPLVTVQGQPTGVPAGLPLQADNALTINQTAPVTALYRPSGGVEGEPEGEGEGEPAVDGFYCQILHNLYTNPLLASFVPEEYRPLFELLNPETADINGGFDLDLLEVYPNGLLDCAYELGVIEAILNNPNYDASASGGVTHAQLLAAYNANKAQIQVDAGPAAAPLINAIAPGLFDLLAAYMTIGDEDSVAAVVALFGLAADLVANPTPNVANYVPSPQFFSAGGDADGDGATNRMEYEAYAQFGPAIYVAFALDPTVFPGTTEGEGEGAGEGEGEPDGEGAVEGEGSPEGEGAPEGEGSPEGEGAPEGEGGAEGEGTPDGEGDPDGEIAPEGEGGAEGEGTGEGSPDGEGVGEGEGGVGGEGEGGAEEGEGQSAAADHSADQNGDGRISLSELLRVIQFYNSARFGCDPLGEDGYAPNSAAEDCAPHASDYNPQDWRIALSELLRLIQFYNSPGLAPCLDGEDGFCPLPN